MPSQMTTTNISANAGAKAERYMHCSHIIVCADDAVSTQNSCTFNNRHAAASSVGCGNLSWTLCPAQLPHNQGKMSDVPGLYWYISVAWAEHADNMQTCTVYAAECLSCMLQWSIKDQAKSGYTHQTRRQGIALSISQHTN